MEFKNVFEMYADIIANYCWNPLHRLLDFWSYTLLLFIHKFDTRISFFWHLVLKNMGQAYLLLIIVTRHFFYKKTFMIKVIQNFMEITLCFNCFSEKTCWKMLFNILFSVLIFDTMFLFWFVGGCCLVAIAWSRTRLQMSTKKGQNLNLKNFFQQVLLEYVFI